MTKPQGIQPNSGEPAKILIGDDDSDILESIRLILKNEKWAIDCARSPAGLLAALASAAYDAVLIDLNYARDTTGGQEGIDLISSIRGFDPDVPVLVMTAWSSVGLAVEAMRRGARDFLEKPFEPSRLRTALAVQIELRRAIRRGRILEAEVESLRGPENTLLMADSPSMRTVMQLCKKAGPSEANILISGEPGVGKEVIARFIHSISGRSSKPLITVNMGGLSEMLFESELFGHVKGAFTDAKAERIGRFELAQGGTLFLDEIGNVPMSLQAKLLRVLEAGEMERVGSSRTIKVDVRLISATNANLPEEVANNRFREDLLYRLNTVQIQIPPLRERKKDIPSLAAHFLRLHALRYRKSILGFDEEAMSAILASRWRGNVRELNHVIERAVIMAEDETIRLADLSIPNEYLPLSRLEDLTLEEVEEVLIRKALARCNGDATQAARALGLSRSALYRRLQNYGV